MMKCGAAGEGEGITVGSGLGVLSVLGVEAPEAEQDVSKMASRERPILSVAEGLRASRRILSQREVQTMRESSHGLTQDRVQVCGIVLEK